MLLKTDIVENRTQVKNIFPTSTAAINSNSVELSAIVSWKQDLYNTTAPSSMITIHVTNLRCWESPAQSESLILNNILLDIFGVQLWISCHNCCLCGVLELVQMVSHLRVLFSKSICIRLWWHLNIEKFLALLEKIFWKT